MNDTAAAIFLILFCLSPAWFHLIYAIVVNKEGRRTTFRRLLKYLKWSLMILIPVTIGLGVISHTNYFDYQKPMKFDEYDQISFDNFRGIELFKKSLYGNERFAYIVTSIHSEIEEDGVIVQSLFHPSRSFVYKQNAFSDELLTHEKYHFKITELFVRKAKKELSALRKPSKKQINEILRKVKWKANQYQKSYDHDTFHSYVYGEQKRYEREIDSMLVLLSDYELPKVKFNESY